MSIGYDTVEVELGVSDTNSRRTNILVSIEAVAAKRHATRQGIVIVLLILDFTIQYIAISVATNTVYGNIFRQYNILQYLG